MIASQNHYSDLLHALFAYHWKTHLRLNLAVNKCLLTILSTNILYAKNIYRHYIHQFYDFPETLTAGNLLFIFLNLFDTILLILFIWI
jgi:hypothetical protein